MSTFLGQDISVKRDLKPFKVIKIGKNDVVVNYGGVYNCTDLSRVDVDKTKRVWLEENLEEIYLTATAQKLTVYLEVEHESRSSLGADSWARLVSARVDIDSELPEADDTKMYLELTKLKMEDLGEGDEVTIDEGIIEQEVWIAIRGEGSDSSEESSEESSSEESSNEESSGESDSEENSSNESDSDESASDSSDQDNSEESNSDEDSSDTFNESDDGSDSNESEDSGVATSDDSNGDSNGNNGGGNSDDSSDGPSYNPNFHIISINSLVISEDGYALDIGFSYEEGDGVGWVDIQYRRVGRLTYYVVRCPLPGLDPGGPHSISIPSLEVSDGTYLTGEDPDNSNPSAPAISEVTYLGTGDVYYL